MRFHLFFLCFVSFLFILVESIENAIQDHGVIIRTDLHQCNANETLLIENFSVAETVFNDAMNSCEQNCCAIDRISKTNICQATVFSPGGNCLGRLCYFGTCDQFLSLANVTGTQQEPINRTIVETLQSSLAFIPWSSAVRSSYTQWKSWIHNNSYTTHHLIVVVLSITNLFLTLIALSVVIKSIKHANLMAGRTPYRYTLL